MFETTHGNETTAGPPRQIKERLLPSTCEQVAARLREVSRADAETSGAGSILALTPLLREASAAGDPAAGLLLRDLETANRDPAGYSAVSLAGVALTVERYSPST